MRDTGSLGPDMRPRIGCYYRRAIEDLDMVENAVIEAEAFDVRSVSVHRCRTLINDRNGAAQYSGRRVIPASAAENSGIVAVATVFRIVAAAAGQCVVGSVALMYRCRCRLTFSINDLASP